MESQGQRRIYSGDDVPRRRDARVHQGGSSVDVRRVVERRALPPGQVRRAFPRGPRAVRPGQARTAARRCSSRPAIGSPSTSSGATVETPTAGSSSWTRRGSAWEAPPPRGCSAPTSWSPGSPPHAFRAWSHTARSSCRRRRHHGRRVVRTSVRRAPAERDRLGEVRSQVPGTRSRFGILDTLVLTPVELGRSLMWFPGFAFAAAPVCRAGPRRSHPGPCICRLVAAAPAGSGEHRLRFPRRAGAECPCPPGPALGLRRGGRVRCHGGASRCRAPVLRTGLRGWRPPAGSSSRAPLHCGPCSSSAPCPRTSKPPALGGRHFSFRWPRRPAYSSRRPSSCPSSDSGARVPEGLHWPDEDHRRPYRTWISTASAPSRSRASCSLDTARCAAA